MIDAESSWDVMLEQYGGNDMFGKLEIRIAEPIDYDEIIEVFDSWTRENWDKKYAERYYREFFDNRHCRPKDEVFVGVVNGRIVGVTGYCPDLQESDDIHWLNWFYVHKHFLNHGYGGLLLDHVIEILKTKKARKLYVDTTSNKLYEDAKALYESRGFIPEGTLKDYYGKGEDQIIYGMSLN